MKMPEAFSYKKRKVLLFQLHPHVGHPKLVMGLNRVFHSPLEMGMEVPSPGNPDGVIGLKWNDCTAERYESFVDISFTPNPYVFDTAE